MFAAHEEGEGAAEVGVAVEEVGVGGGGDGADFLFAEEGEEFFAFRDDDGDGEEDAGGGADDVGVEDVGNGVAEDDGVDSGGVGAAEEGAEVSGFFNAFADEEERVGGELEVGEAEAVLIGDAEEAVGSVAVGAFLEGGFGEFEKLGAGGFGVGEELVFVFAEEPVAGEIEFADGDLAGEGAGQFAVAFDEELGGGVAVAAVAEFYEVFDPWILKTGDEFGGHES